MGVASRLRRLIGSLEEIVNPRERWEVLEEVAEDLEDEDEDRDDHEDTSVTVTTEGGTSSSSGLLSKLGPLLPLLLGGMGGFFMGNAVATPNMATTVAPADPLATTEDAPPEAPKPDNPPVTTPWIPTEDDAIIQKPTYRPPEALGPWNFGMPKLNIEYTPPRPLPQDVIWSGGGR